MGFGGLALAGVVLAGAAPPPRLFAALSQDAVDIGYRFAGAEVLVYGAVQYPRGRVPDDQPRIAVVARGPDEEVIVRRKARVAGLWVNRDAVTFRRVPSFAAVLTSRPVDELVDPATAALWEIGLGNLALQPMGRQDEADTFARGLADLRAAHRLFVEEPRGVAVTENILWRARLHVPSAAPEGLYSVSVHLIEEGAVVATVTRTLQVRKTGLEASVSDWAERAPLTYGLAAVLFAVGTGWAASAIGRR